VGTGRCVSICQSTPSRTKTRRWPSGDRRGAMYLPGVTQLAERLALPAVPRELNAGGRRSGINDGSSLYGRVNLLARAVRGDGRCHHDGLSAKAGAAWVEGLGVQDLAVAPEQAPRGRPGFRRVEGLEGVRKSRLVSRRSSSEPR
jgi:hypothetical protein